MDAEDKSMSASGEDNTEYPGDTAHVVQIPTVFEDRDLVFMPEPPMTRTSAGCMQSTRVAVAKLSLFFDFAVTGFLPSLFCFFKIICTYQCGLLLWNPCVRIMAPSRRQ